MPTTTKPKLKRHYRTPYVDVRRETSKDGRIGSRVGVKATGLYPHVSRTKLAELTGKHISTMTGILKGRTRPGLDLAVVMARAIGVGIEQFNRDLKRAQGTYKAKAGAKCN